MQTIIKWRSALAIVGLTLILTLAATSLPHAAQASAGPRSYTYSRKRDVFLGGNYIELGISKSGSFGTHPGFIPEGFFGGNGEDDNIGIATNPAGFGEEPDLRMDFTLPGSPEERWAVGYTIDGDQTYGSNSLLEGPIDISNNTVKNQTVGGLLKATSVGTFNSKLQTSQEISFRTNDRFFKNMVTLKNVGDTPINSVRYMRSFDPDNTGFQGGSYNTQNQIPYTIQAGDGMAAVVADTSNNSDDPVFLVNGTRSPIMFFSKDPRARVSTFNFTNVNPYEDEAYNDALPKGTSIDDDIAITITFDVGTLNPGQSKKFSYYTSIDNRGLTTAINMIKCGTPSCTP